MVRDSRSDDLGVVGWCLVGVVGVAVALDFYSPFKVLRGLLLFLKLWPKLAT